MILEPICERIVKLVRMASSNPAPILTVSTSTGLPSFFFINPLQLHIIIIAQQSKITQMTTTLTEIWNSGKSCIIDLPEGREV